MADRILVEKRARKLTLLHQGVPFRSYRVALGRVPVGHKQKAGDGRTPEGLYWIDGRVRASRFHRSLLISYPRRADEHQAREAGLSTGGRIMIHGLPPGAAWMGRLHSTLDWTEGCIAVTNEEINEIWELVADGTTIEIRP